MPANFYDRLELIKRQKQIVDWILIGWSTRMITDECIKLWGVGERTCYNYIKKALAMLEDKEEPGLKIKQRVHTERRLKLLRDLKDKDTPSGARTALRILDSIAKIDGSLIEKVDVTSAGEQITGTVVVLPENGRESQ